MSEGWSIGNKDLIASDGEVTHFDERMRLRVGKGEIDSCPVTTREGLARASRLAFERGGRGVSHALVPLEKWFKLSSKTRYSFFTTVARVAREMRIKSSYKVGDETITEEEDLGWFVHFEGSRERMFFGEERPELREGQRVKVTIEPWTET